MEAEKTASSSHLRKQIWCRRVASRLPSTAYPRTRLCETNPFLSPDVSFGLAGLALTVDRQRDQPEGKRETAHVAADADLVGRHGVRHDKG
jgi:hypothetical protein